MDNNAFSVFWPIFGHTCMFLCFFRFKSPSKMSTSNRAPLDTKCLRLHLSHTLSPGKFEFICFSSDFSYFFGNFLDFHSFFLLNIDFSRLYIVSDAFPSPKPPSMLVNREFLLKIQKSVSRCRNCVIFEFSNEIGVWSVWRPENVGKWTNRQWSATRFIAIVG